MEPVKIDDGQRTVVVEDDVLLGDIAVNCHEGQSAPPNVFVICS
jgi:hypothetical protein